MIDIGTLPEPQWMTLGKRVERIYSLEWLVLASAQLNVRRLSGLEVEIAPANTIQFAIRFEHADWSLSELTTKLVALDRLWGLCALALSPDGSKSAPSLTLRRLSAGSPLDILAWVTQDWFGLVGAGGLVSLFIYVLKNPDKVASAIPRSIAAWRDGWASADDAAVRMATARRNREEFEREAPPLLHELDAVPTDTALSGHGTRKLELVSSESELTVLRELEEPRQRAESSQLSDEASESPNT